jgi:hypothetical protein
MKKVHNFDVATKNLKATLSKQDAINIYSVRSKLPSAMNGQVKGFDKLLEGLNNLNNDFVTILKQDKSLVFTNQDNEVIGKLVFETKI